MRVKKKSEIAPSISRAAPIAPKSPDTAAVPPSPPPESPPDVSNDEDENIYEVMKGHMRRQKEEQDARNAQARQQPRMGGRPGPQGAITSSTAAAKPVVEKVADPSDLPSVWTATRAHLRENVRYLESVLGHCCHVESLNVATGETVLIVPGNQQGFTNEKARAKIEESLRAVTGLGIRLALQFAEVDMSAAAQEASRSTAGPMNALQRVPAEVVEAVKEQHVVKQLMKQLDANIVNIELLGTNEEE